MTAPRGRRNTGSRPGRAERRRQLLDHAGRLFAAQGYDATTTEQIAAAAGVRESSLKRHFADKNVLFRAVLDELQAVILRPFTELAETDANPQAQLNAIADGLLECVRTQTIPLRAMSRALAESEDAEARAALAEFALRWQDLLAGIIAGGQQSGFFRRSLDPQVGAWQLIHAALAVPLTQPLGIPLHAQADYPARAIDCALHGLLKTDI
jgi:AcrR family transcriptional regulator